MVAEGKVQRTDKGEDKGKGKDTGKKLGEAGEAGEGATLRLGRHSPHHRRCDTAAGDDEKAEAAAGRSAPPSSLASF